MRRTKIDCCTRDCPDRCADPNCHESCEKYLTQKAELEKSNEESRKLRQVSVGINQQKFNGCFKATKYKHKGR